MTTTITLTGDQVRAIMDDADRKVELLSIQELEAIASRLNEKINIPFLSEEQEQVVLVKIIKQIDRYLYSVLPNEVYQMVKDASDGISEEEAEKIKTRLAQLINKAVDIPIVGEEVEQLIFKMVLDLIVLALQKGKSLLDVATQAGAAA